MVVHKGSSNAITTAEAAHLLHLHINTVRRWSDNGTIRSQRVGPRRDRIFSREDITSLLTEGKVKKNNKAMVHS